jgi:hypothetical protein
MEQKYLEKMSDEELSKHQSGYRERTDGDILANEEWERRRLTRQHEFNLKLITEQARLNKVNVWITAIVSILATILGTCTGALMSRWLSGLTQ